MKKLAFIFSILLVFTAQCFATTYYVRKDGNNGNSGTTNNASGAWLTIDYALSGSSGMGAGDVVRVQTGDYSETVTPSISGSGSDSGLITAIADGTVTVNAFTFTGQDYIRIIGFTIDVGQINFNSGVNTGIEIWNNTITGGVGIASDNNLATNEYDTYLENCLIIGNTINPGSYGLKIACIGCIVAYNNSNAGNNDFNQSAYTDSIIVGNYTHDFDGGGNHFDFFQTYGSFLGFQNNLIEGNYIHGIGNSNEHISSIQTQSSTGTFYNNIYRYNLAYFLGNGGLSIDQITNGATYTIAYNNTNCEMQEATDDIPYGDAILWGGSSYNLVKNDLGYEAWSNNKSTGIESIYLSGTGSTKDYNFAADPDGTVSFASSWTSQAHEVSNGDPDFQNYPTNFYIGSSSDAIGNAGPLTTVTSASNTGTTFNVDVGEYFRGDYTGFSQYGGGLSAGDVITVGDGANRDVVRISSISGDALTVESSFTWANGENVYFGDSTKWSQSTPDIGAYPYKSGGYTLSGTYNNSGGTISITPNDADLVRTVVVFEDGIPIGADSIAPFSVSGAGAGTLIVRMYPKYASTTLYTDATESDTLPESRASGRFSIQ